MSAYGYTKANQKKVNNFSVVNWILFGVLSLVLIWSPFQVALFNGQMAAFDLKIYYSVLLASILMAVCAWSIFKSKLTLTNQTILLVAVFTLPIVYALSMIMAASGYLAMNMLVIQFVYVSVFAASIFLIANSNKANMLLSKIIVGVAYSIVIFGLFHWFNNTKWLSVLLGWFIPFEDNGVFQHAVMTTVDGQRLTSVFQYANTYAAYLMAFLFVAVFYLTTTRKSASQLVHGFMLVPIILSIFLTLSRGGLLLLPVVFAIVLLFVKPARQLLWIVHLAISGLATLIILNPVTDIGVQVQQTFAVPVTFKGWMYVIGASAVSAAISWVVQRWGAPWLERKLDNFSVKKWSNALVPISGIILAGLVLFIFIGTNAKNLLPQEISTRLENINFQQHSLLERLTFYKDSAKLVADYPLLGAGGGAWAALYEKYQNNPYSIQQAHSFYMQTLDEIGIVGFAVLMIFFAYIYWQYIRSYINSDEEKRESHFIYFLLATSILIHSVMDFNMSYVYVGILVFISLGGMAATIEPKTLEKMKPTTYRVTMGSIMGIVAIGLFITSILFIQGSSAFAKAQTTLLETQDFNQTMVYLKKANNNRPTHPYYTQLTANLYLQVYKQHKNEDYYTEAEAMLKRSLEANPYNKIPLMQQLIELYEAKGLEDEVYQVYSTNAPNFPWDMNWYDKYMDIALREGYKSINTAPENKDKFLDEVIAAFEHVKAGVEHLKTLPEGQLQGNEFYVTSRMAMNAGRAYIMKGDPGQAADAMKPYLQEDLTDANNKELARWYVAATKQQGQVDQAWYDKLVAADPSETEQIEQVAAMRFKAE